MSLKIKFNEIQRPDAFGTDIHQNIVICSQSCSIQINLHLTICLKGMSESYGSFQKAGYQP